MTTNAWNSTCDVAVVVLLVAGVACSVKGAMSRNGVAYEWVGGILLVASLALVGNWLAR